MKTKRFLSILLSLVLVLGMLPGMSLTASAAGNTTEITPTNTSGTMTITLTIQSNTCTVTYDPGRGSGTMEPTKVEKNAEGKFMYKVESCGFYRTRGKDV